ncbi:hypothetical protein ABTL54_20150, partial [Acinetobacter baumannii]
METVLPIDNGCTGNMLRRDFNVPKSIALIFHSPLQFFIFNIQTVLRIVRSENDGVGEGCI